MFINTPTMEIIASGDKVISDYMDGKYLCQRKFV